MIREEIRTTTVRYYYYLYSTNYSVSSFLPPSVRVQDFALGLSILSRGTVAEKLKWTFSLYDINGDGLITREEMTEIVTAIYELAGSPTAASATGASSQLAASAATTTTTTTSSSSSSSHYPHLHLPHLIHGHHHQQQQQRQLDENIIRAKVERIFQVRWFP